MSAQRPGAGDSRSKSTVCASSAAGCSPLSNPPPPGGRGPEATDTALPSDLPGSALPEGVRVVDFGIRGLDLSYALLDGYEAARKANGKRDSRHRVEHIELVTAADVPRFRELGVVASMQPPHPPGAMDFPLEPTVSRIGRARWPLAYAWRTLKDAGAHVVFASDWPVSDVNPMRGIKAAVTRKRWAKEDPDQSFSVIEALAAYTVEGAYAGFAEDWKGRLKPGFAADLVVLSSDIDTVAPEALDTIHPVTTICGGKITYAA